jgi:hypothetical protein
MEKRARERIPVALKVIVNCGKRVHSATLINISERGMFISTEEMYFPLDTQMEVNVPFGEDVLRIPVSLRRMELSPDSHDGIGVELQGTSREYLTFLNSLKTAL